MKRLLTHLAAFVAGVATTVAVIIVDDWIAQRELERMDDDA